MDPSPSLKGDEENHGVGFSVVASKRVFPGYQGSGHPTDRRSQSFTGGRFGSSDAEKSNSRGFVHSRSSLLGRGASASHMRSDNGFEDASYRGAADVQSHRDFPLADPL